MQTRMGEREWASVVQRPSILRSTIDLAMGINFTQKSVLVISGFPYRLMMSRRRVWGGGSGSVICSLASRDRA